MSDTEEPKVEEIVTPPATPVASSLEDVQAKIKSANEGEFVTLPSGLVFKLKRPSLSKMIRDKKVPSNLVSAAIRLTQGSNTQNPSDMSDNVRLMEHIIIQALVEPQGLTEEDISNLSDEDKGAAFIYVQQGGIGLDSFRKKLVS